MSDGVVCKIDIEVTKRMGRNNGSLSSEKSGRVSFELQYLPFPPCADGENVTNYIGEIISVILKKLQ